MKKLPAFVLIILISTLTLHAKEQPQKEVVLLSVGTNFSSYLHEAGRPKVGYNFGLTFNIHVYKNLSMTLPFSYTRINAAPQNVEDRNYPNTGENIYKILIDWQVSVAFFEVPVLFTYKVLTKNSYDIRYILGPGLVIAKKDFSRIEDVTKTDEIIGVEKYSSPLVPLHSLTLPMTNINTGIRLHKNRLYIDLLYILYPAKIKEINKLNSISLRLGIDII